MYGPQQREPNCCESGSEGEEVQYFVLKIPKESRIFNSFTVVNKVLGC